jgi:hypothetical protein
MKNSGVDADHLREDHTIYIETASNEVKNFPLNSIGSTMIASKAEPSNMSIGVVLPWSELLDEPKLKDQ